MCGIFGHSIIDRDVEDIEVSRAALHTLSHRGPDQWGDAIVDDAYMGHRRLSILDLSDAGRQPMETIRSDGSKVVLIANGEIWNFKALRELLSANHEFVSHSDCEVLLHGYIEWGIDGLLDRIDGMYAFSIYDSRDESIFVARDRFGVKPLYYVLPCEESGQRFVFASEIKALFCFAPELKAFSQAGIVDWLAHRGSYSDLTLYHKVLKLLPSTYVRYDLSTRTHACHTYYDILDHVGDDSDAGDLEGLFEGAIEKRLMADVPLGVQLSGGVDSSLVTRSMAKSQGKGLKSFSIGFKEAREQHLSEEPYARKVAEQFDLDHHQINIDRGDVRAAFEHVVWLCDGMLDFPNTIPIYLLSKHSKQFVTAQLTGEGADELFGGYTKFQRMSALGTKTLLSHALRIVPDCILNLSAKLKPELARRLHLQKYYAGERSDILNRLNCYIRPETITSIFGETAVPLLGQMGLNGDDRFNALSFDKQLIVMDHKTYLHAVLERQDRASMGASLESRVPFLDRVMVEWALKLPLRDLFDRRGCKRVLKNWAARVFGHDFAYRRKVGFPMPIRNWMHDDEGLGEFYARTQDKDFIFHDEFQAYLARPHSFDNVLLNYGDSERQWVEWFMMVLRAAQDQFDITEVKP